MPLLSDITIFDGPRGPRLHGTVIEHARYPDGTDIRTGTIISAVDDFGFRYVRTRRSKYAIDGSVDLKDLARRIKEARNGKR